MDFKKLFAFFKEKEIDMPAEKFMDLIGEDKQDRPVIKLPDYENLNHNKNAIDELKKLFESELAKKDKTIEELNTKFDSFMKTAQEKDEERATREKAWQEEKEAKEKAEKESKVKSIIETAVNAGKIAPENTALIDRYKSIEDIETLESIISALPTPNTTNIETRPNQPHIKMSNSTKQDVDAYLSDLVIN